MVTSPRFTLDHCNMLGLAIFPGHVKSAGKPWALHGNRESADAAKQTNLNCERCGPAGIAARLSLLRYGCALHRNFVHGRRTTGLFGGHQLRIGYPRFSTSVGDRAAFSKPVAMRATARALLGLLAASNIGPSCSAFPAATVISSL